MSSRESLRAQSSAETPLISLAFRMGAIWLTRALGSLPTRRLSKPIPSCILAIAWRGESGGVSEGSSDVIVVEPRLLRYSL